MKKIITILLMCIGLLSYTQTTSIPDVNFEQALIDAGIDSDGVINGQVLTSDVSGVTDLSVGNSNISDLTGIEDFVSLTWLSAYNNFISSVDLTNNTALTLIHLDYNNLTGIDLTNNTQLTTLWIGYNDITSIDLSHNPNLGTLKIEHNKLTLLDLSNRFMQTVECDNNLLTNLNVSNSSFTELVCYGNPLTVLDISSTSFSILNCSDTSISTLNTTGKNFSSLDAYGTNISSLDLSSATWLENIWVARTNITSLDLSNTSSWLDYVNFEYCDNLTEVNLKNGYNTNISVISGFDTPNLSCIEVDDATYSTTNWSSFVDPGVTFSENCAALNIDEQILDFATFFPNPVTTQLTIITKKPSNYTITDITGKTIMSGQLHLGTHNIDTSSLTSGIFIMKINDGKQMIAKKIIKDL